MVSKMKLSAVIMGHPKRQKFIDELSEQLPGVPVVLDRMNNRWDTGERSLLAYERDATHHVVVQDDAVLCKDFLAGCEAVAAAQPDRPISLYIGKVRPHQQTVSPAVEYVLRYGGAWLQMEGPWWGVAVIMPTKFIPKLAEWGKTRNHIVNYDKRMARWFHLQRIPCLYTIPNLVDHRPVEENPSLVPGRNGNRQAQCFIGLHKSPLSIDWSVEPTPLMVKFREKRSGKTVRIHRGGHNFRRMASNKGWEEVS